MPWISSGLVSSAHEDHLAAPRALRPLGVIGVEHDLTRCRARRRRKAAAPARPSPASGSMRRMQQLIEREASTRITASLGDEQPSSARSTAILQAPLPSVRLPERVCSTPQLAVLDGELDVLHVAVVLLEAPEHRRQAWRTPPASVLRARAFSPASRARARSAAAACGCRRPRPRPGR